MHPYITAVTERLAAARADLRAAVDQVPAAARTKRPAAERWSVAEVLEHLSLVEALFTKRVVDAITAARESDLGPEAAAERAALPGDIARIVADRVNRRTAPDVAHPRAGLDAESAWAAVERARRVLDDTLREADGLALSGVTTAHPAFGTLNVYQMAELIAGHEARHTAQIREIAAQLAVAGS